MANVTDRHTETIKAVDRAFSIIEYLYKEEESDMQELADHLGVAKSTVYKHLNTLQQRGWVVETDHTYRLSYQFLHVGGYVRDRQRLCKVAQQNLREFTDEVNLMAMFSILEGDEGVFLYRINDTLGLGKGIPIGVRFDLHKNAAGKAILAALPDDRITEIVSTKGLSPETENTITDEEELWGEIESVRNQGYAINIGERKAQLSAVACTVEDPEQHMLGAISICGPTSRLPEADLHELGDETKVVAEEIELQIKYG
jgi:DNA-binding IclR family transcriptional regulator